MGFTDMMKQDEIEATYAIVETVADPVVRELRPKQRRCLFPNEASKLSSVRLFNVDIRDFMLTYVL